MCHQLLDPNPVSSKQSLSMIQLPSDILLAIYKVINHPRDQIAFALSSKKLAAISVHTNFNTRRSKSWDRKHLYMRKDLMLDLRRWNWIPPHLKLCKSCLKYLPTRRIWRDREGQELCSLKLVDWPWMIHDWMRDGKKCPTCQMPDDFDEDKQYVQCEPRGFARWVPVKHELMR